MTISEAAAKSGVSVNTAKRYIRSGISPSDSKAKQISRAQGHSFSSVWDEVTEILEASPTAMAKTILTLLMRSHPGQFHASQLRSLQRQIKKWRLAYGEDQEAMFPQIIKPGVQSQSDYTVMDHLNITINGAHHKHLLFHFMLPYSRWEDVMICYTESFETLTQGFEQAVHKLGGVLPEHRTDNLSAATKRFGSRRTFTDSWRQFLAHYQIKPSRNNPGKSHENGSVEKSHDLLKKAIDQELILRGSREFKSLEDYQSFLNQLVLERNQSRVARMQVEQDYLLALPARKWYAPRVSLVTVSPASIINIDSVIYSVPTRLIGETLTAHIFVDQIKLLFGQQCIHTLQKYESGPVIDYRHLIDSLLKKPAAFIHYQYQDAFFPGRLFRLAYDRLTEDDPKRGYIEYLRILKYSKSYGESAVKTGLEIMLENRGVPSAKGLKSLLYLPKDLPSVKVEQPRLHEYNALLTQLSQGEK